MVSRKDFIKYAAFGSAVLAVPGLTLFDSDLKVTQEPVETIVSKEFRKLPPPEYYDISHSDINWQPIVDGLDFTRIEVYRGEELVDIIVAVKIDSKTNKIQAYNGFDSNTESLKGTIEDWQDMTGATVMINSAQYMANPHYKPCALVMGYKTSRDGQNSLKFDLTQIGPKTNIKSRGMLVSEPTRNGYPNADILDFDYDNFDHNNTPYTHGVQHWPMLLDRNG